MSTILRDLTGIPREQPVTWEPFPVRVGGLMHPKMMFAHGEDKANRKASNRQLILLRQGAAPPSSSPSRH